MASQNDIPCYTTANGVQVYRIPVEVFPQYIAYLHLVDTGSELVLVDTGSAWSNSFDDLQHGLAQLNDAYGKQYQLAALSHVVVTHGHIDHFGGLSRVMAHAQKAKVCAHELTRPVLMNYDARVYSSRNALDSFFHRAGVPEERIKRLLEMYMFGKTDYLHVDVDISLRDGDCLADLMEIIHVPGHSPGLVMIRIDDILLSADHVLPSTSVAIAPEYIMPYTGTGHYLDSLDKALEVSGISLALGGHEEPMSDFLDVVSRARQSTLSKIDSLLELCSEPHTMYDLVLKIYDNVDGYSEILKLEQVGARLEYLNQRGYVMIENYLDLENDLNPVLRYRRI